MKTIKLKKIEIIEIEILQKELFNFLTFKNSQFIHKSIHDNSYFDTILLIDIAQKMYYNFRGKIEKINTSFSSLHLTCSEAIVLLQCCNDKSQFTDEPTKFVLEKFQSLIFKELSELSKHNLLTT